MIDPDLPDELQSDQEYNDAAEQREEMLAAIGQAIAKKRDEAVAARKENGIEQIWIQAEEAYLCIDDMNRAEFAKAKWAKPMAMQAPVIAEVSKGSGDGRSNVFIRLTARYVDMGAAKVSEIVLPVDGKAFSFKGTPVPDLVSPLTPVAQAMPGQPPAVDPSIQASNAADDAAKKAEKRVYDWMVEGHYTREMRKVIHDAAKLGVGVLKGPYPVVKKRRAITQKTDGNKIIVKVDKVAKVVPGYKRIDPWNCYPHAACGEDIKTGDYFFEKDTISPATLKALKQEKDPLGNPVYLSSQIDKVLEQGPEGHKETDGRPNQKAKKENYNIWYFTGTISRDDLSLLNSVAEEELPNEVTDISAVVTIVNDSVIRATLNPLEGGNFGYNALPWSPRSGSWVGVGVAEQVATPQKIVNNSARALFNNAGVSAGVQIVMDPLAIIAANSSNIITPNKLWYLQPGTTIDDVRKAFAAIEIPNITAQLMPIIDFGMKMAEESTNIPLITQGHDGEQTPQTFGQSQLQNTNANTLLRSIGSAVDEHITTPVVEDSYDWLLADPDVPDEEKGDFYINCTGSSTFVEAAIQEQTLMQMAGIVINPAFGINPEKWMEKTLKAKRFDPRELKFTDEEKAKMAQSQQQSPQVQAATINAQARLQAANIMAGVTVEKVKADTDRDVAYTNSLANRDQNNHAARMAELEAKIALAQLEYANTNKLTLEKVKAELAKTAMALNTQKELSFASMNLDAHKHNTPQITKPAVEPVGRAAPGMAFAE